MKRLTYFAFLFFSVLAGADAVQAGPVSFTSSPQATSFLELYSSEGCSSCPPADAWLGTLRQEAGLWKRFVPVAFHVDYWNHLGWADRFSNGAFTARQKEYSGLWRAANVYTPEFVLNGKDWRTERDSGALQLSKAKVGVLKVVEGKARHFTVEFAPQVAGEKWVAYGALLGNGLVNQVTSGENSGTTLHHEFVALELKQAAMAKQGKTFTATFELTPREASKAKGFSVAVWVAREGELTPLQATGGDLP